MSMLSTIETVGIVFLLALLVLRQFQWKAASEARLLRLPAILILAGVVELCINLIRGEILTWDAIGALAVELILVSTIGLIMGRMSILRVLDGQSFYRLTRIGILLWALFLVVRIGSFASASVMDIHILETTGVILISFGLNRLASALILRRRLSTEIPQPREGSHPARDVGSA